MQDQKKLDEKNDLVTKSLDKYKEQIAILETN